MTCQYETVVGHGDAGVCCGTGSVGAQEWELQVELRDRVAMQNLPLAGVLTSHMLVLGSQ